MKSKREYPKNLIYDLFGEDREIEITEDILKGIEFAINQLDEKQGKIVNQYYKNNLTLKQVSESLCLGVSGEEIRRLKSRALRKLRKPKYIKFITKGYTIGKEYLKEISNSENQDSFDLQNIDISVRSYNCLKRGNINNMLEIKSINQLKRIKHLGSKGTSEIIDILKKHGITLPEESE